MKSKTNLFSLLSLVISTFTAIFVVYYTYQLNLVTNEVSRQYANDKEAVLEIIENVYAYRTPYTIDYEGLDEVQYTNYNCADPLWNNSEKYNLGEAKYKLHNACWAYDHLAKMRNDFQRKTVKARVLGSDEIITALDEIEQGFDEVLDYYLSHEYYLRAFPDAYLEVMPEKFDNLVDVARKEMNTSPK